MYTYKIIKYRHLKRCNLRNFYDFITHWKDEKDFCNRRCSIGTSVCVVQQSNEVKSQPNLIWRGETVQNEIWKISNRECNGAPCCVAAAGRQLDSLRINPRETEVITSRIMMMGEGELASTRSPDHARTNLYRELFQEHKKKMAGVIWWCTLHYFHSIVVSKSAFLAIISMTCNNKANCDSRSNFSYGSKVFFRFNIEVL